MKIPNKNFANILPVAVEWFHANVQPDARRRFANSHINNIQESL